MQPLHDNDLDRISREAADRFEVDSGASGWAHLEKRLDEELPQKKKKRRFLFWLLFITLTTGGAVTALLTYRPATPLAKNASSIAPKADNTDGQEYQATQNPDAGKPAYSRSQPSVDQVPAASGTSSKINTNGRIEPAPAGTSASTPDKNSGQAVTKPGDAKKQKLTNTAGVHRNPLTMNYATIPPVNAGKNKTSSTRSSRGKGKQQQTSTDRYKRAGDPVQGSKTALDAPIPAEDRSTAAEPVEGDQNTATTTPPANDPPATAKAENKLPASPVDSVKDQVQQPVKKQDRKKNEIKQPFEIGLVAGPDKSAVSFGPLYKTGYILGLQLGYRLSNHWSVNTGVLYTKKYYQADSQYFHYKSNWGNWPLKDVEGNCSMWEIPVNVRYDVSYNEKRRWFVSTGLSTYLMDKENYTLNYTSWSGNPYPVPLNTDSNSNYLFSIWNLSLGFERSLGRNFSIQAEPYLRVPLKGLGTGSMRMNSYGIFFTLKYKPSFHSKKPDNRK
ncbi:outer membrane beta-barrel protein [Longitalea arenae]|uniref:outer membrane beta-barrel protein n=1 Tax=Longitalea arenae TaxID=2812558 RepID=UPI001967FAF9|nr:outer membrane beta-barrel protein [Longitalea arenae]